MWRRPWRSLSFARRRIEVSNVILSSASCGRRYFFALLSSGFACFAWVVGCFLTALHCATLLRNNLFNFGIKFSLEKKYIYIYIKNNHHQRGDTVTRQYTVGSWFVFYCLWWWSARVWRALKALRATRIVACTSRLAGLAGTPAGLQTLTLPSMTEWI